MAVKQNLIANFAGNAWAGLMGVVFVPIYLKYIGAEGYGLVGFYTMIIAVLTILDGGFGAAASRELARAHTEIQFRSLNNLIRTLEWLFWGMAFALGIGLIILAPWISGEWLHVQHLDAATAADAVRLMGAALILQWPAVYYRGCIIGLQKQIGLNAITAIMASVRGGGAALVLWGLAPTVRAFFAWQVVSALINVLVLRQYLWKKMPEQRATPRFSITTVHEIGRFAVAVGLTNVLSLVLSQLDKIILSKVLPLSQFGYYTLAATLTGLIYQFIGPVFNAFYPRLTQVVSLGRDLDIARLYHRACQTMALSVVPVALLITFFGRDIIWVWTGDAQLADNIRYVVALLAIGTMCNGLMTVPYALQLANAWTLFAFWQNVAAACILAPLIYLLATHYGLLGAASVWPLLNIGYIAISAPIMYRRLLRSEMRHWYAYSVLIPVVECSIYLSGARTLIDATGIGSSSRVVLVCAVASIFLGCFLLAGFSMPELRHRLLTTIGFKVKIAAGRL